ncbi:MAG: chemotaxis-specific protein-glutamate methyltransferase CheB [Spirochaetales bacterium]
MRVLIADDSLLFRRSLGLVLGSLPGVEVVGQAISGQQTLEKIRELSPDLVTLDLEMPHMGGLEVLEALRSEIRRPAVLVVSSLSVIGGQQTVLALQNGAFDFITKPEGAGTEASLKQLRAELAPKLRALGYRLGVRSLLQGASPSEPPPPRPRPSAPTATVPGPQRAVNLVLIGISTGGPGALATLLTGWGPPLGVPVVIVQHMPPLFTRSLAENLTRQSGLDVREAEHGETAQPDRFYIAAGGRHLRLMPGRGATVRLELNDEPPEHNCRPAVNQLFRSAAEGFSGTSVAVVMTGMGSDGTEGLRALRQAGCYALAQDEASSIVWGMPGSVVRAGLVDRVLPLPELASAIRSFVTGNGQ